VTGVQTCALPISPALALRFWLHIDSPAAQSAVFGIAILGAAFLLSWGAEVAQMDISQAMALAFLALITVLPEYAVDVYFAWSAGQNFGTELGSHYASYTTANMTGANRLLIGIGWPLVFFLFWLKQRRRKGVVLELEPIHYLELSYLALATLYAFFVFIKGIDLFDSFVLITLFVLYVLRASRVRAEEPELVGPARTLGQLIPWFRRTVVVFLFLFAGFIILLSAEPFAEGLVETGKRLKIDEFLLVQWLAPLASEAPEITVATVFTLRGFASAGFGALVSSKINQWTLLIGTLPVAYSIALGRAGAIPLDGRQFEEVLLTSAQSAFALAVLVNLQLSFREAALMVILFVTQLLIPDPRVRMGYAAGYLALALLIMVRERGATLGLIRHTGQELLWSVRPGHAPRGDESTAPVTAGDPSDQR
jgi:cation:H+ antiporter